MIYTYIYIYIYTYICIYIYIYAFTTQLVCIAFSKPGCKEARLQGSQPKRSCELCKLTIYMPTPTMSNALERVLGLAPEIISRIACAAHDVATRQCDRRH